MADELNDMLFHLLWVKDAVFDSSTKAIIPQTIIYKYYQPRYWFFTSQDGTIKRKSKDKLTKEQIQHDFMKAISPSGIIAVYYCIYKNKRVIEYLTTKTFNEFLYKRKIEYDGILQKFVDPYGSKNFALTAIWTPNFCMFEKKENKLDLFNQSFDLYERAMTFEGKEYFVEATPLRGNDIPRKLQENCDSIVSHVSAVSFEKLKIARMVVHFRIDSKMRLWLLCATSLRFSTDAHMLPIDLNAEMGIPKILNPKKLTVDFKNPAILIKSVKCSMCEAMFELDKIAEMDYRVVISLLKDEEIPIIIRNIHPRLKINDYKRLRNHEKFLEKKAQLCFDCFLSLSRNLPSSGVLKSVPRCQSLSGIGPLHPDRLQSRRDRTMSSLARSPVNARTPSTASSRNVFSSRTSKTAGGELILMPLSPV
ncbi:unnamed protein product [Blepharisma stoltei]|uniref:Uncharacterized protein n=1 Tax=Blepharisma stoltei TaxID=1481888 RepID=A0AAU9KAJ4_9CILI|nr:unnamed protein product [Blepharisma stoltei]